MSMFTSRATLLREAVGLVRRNPAGVAELDAQEAAAHAQAEADAKRKAAAVAKVERDISERAQQIIDDWVDREQAALRLAAERLAREQLERKHGVVEPQTAAMSPAAVRLSASMLDRARGRVADAPVPWDKRGRTASQYRSDEARAAAEIMAPKVLDRQGVDERIAERRQKLHEQRQAQIADRKRERGLIPADPT